MTAEIKQQAWDWICELYVKPEVKSACHVLQDRNHVDVTFFLYLCWLDKKNLKPKYHYLTVNGDFDRDRKAIRRTRKLRRFFSTLGMTKGLADGLLEKEIAREKEMFLALMDVETMPVKGEAVQAKQYIMYKGALKSVAWRVIRKNLDR